MKKFIASFVLGAGLAAVVVPGAALGAGSNNVSDQTSDIANAVTVHGYLRSHTTSSTIYANLDPLGVCSAYYLRMWDYATKNWYVYSGWTLFSNNTRANNLVAGRTIPGGLKFQDGDYQTCNSSSGTYYTGTMFY